MISVVCGVNYFAGVFYGGRWGVGVGAEAPAPLPGASFQIPWNQEARSGGVVSQSAFPAPGSEPTDVTLSSPSLLLGGCWGRQ